MEADAAETQICTLVANFRSRLDQIASIARAADSYAKSGDVAHRAQILMDFEGPRPRCAGSVQGGVDN